MIIGVLIALAAAIGAALRHLVLERLNGQFPNGTLVVNVGASFVLGALSQSGDAWQAVLGIGALGALSVWSTVANEVADLARDDQGGVAVLYLFASVSTGVLAAWAGIQLAA